MWGWFQRRASAAGPVLKASEPQHFFQIKASVLSERGVRDSNEDAVCVLTHPDARLRSVRMVGLADGMGGHAAGEVASRTCLQTCTEHLQEGTEQGLGPQLLATLHEANRQVWLQAKTQPELNGMGTTLCLLAFEAGGHYQFAWVGDSRIYRLRHGALLQLTEDDTVVNALLRQGVLSAEDALRHPERHVLAQAIGTAPELDRPHLGQPGALEDGDIFLLASDGVHDVLTHEQLAALLGPDIHGSGQRIVEHAKQADSQDNLSVVVVHVQRKALADMDPHPQPGKVTTVEAQTCE